MIIKVLSENTPISAEFGSEHGLSLYIETEKHKILFDTGASELFAETAEKLDIDLSKVDLAVISHGHYDHGGGLYKFLQINTKAQVFLHCLAFGKYYVLGKNDILTFIGLDEGLKQNKQIVLTSGRCFINEGIEVFSNINTEKTLPIANSGLLMEQNGQKTDDNFAHEQNLLIEENGKLLLITGCAHNGIINILEHFQYLYRRMPDYVIGGFHLSSRAGYHENLETINIISEYLLKTKAKYYTCHCTGIEPYKQLKAAMGDAIDYLSVGRVITI